MKILNLIFLLSLLCYLSSCGFLPESNEARVITDAPFEGEISLSESRGLYGSFFKINTRYYISENSIKREQRLGGINEITDTYAGIIIDLKKDSVTLYYSDPFMKNKHTLSVKDFKQQMRSKQVPAKTPSPVDNTFNFLTYYKSDKVVKDSSVIKGFKSDYTLYTADFLQQETFDTKNINVKRELLEMVFVNLPKEIHFPLKSEFKTSISRVDNDSIINSDGARQIDKLSETIFYNIDTTHQQEETDLEQLSENKLINWGLDVLKIGVDLNIHVTSDISEIKERIVEVKELTLPSGPFNEVGTMDDFFESIPSGGGGDD